LEEEDPETEFRAGRRNAGLNASETVKADLLGCLLHAFAGDEADIVCARKDAVDCGDGDACGFGEVGDGRAAHFRMILFVSFIRIIETNDTISCFRYHGGLI
jgi:hypothetical protein